jgi:hypothetical protein
MNREMNAKLVLKTLRMRKLPQFNNIEEVGDFVTKYMVKHYKLGTYLRINNGYCFIWAYLVWALMKEPVSFVSSDGHVVVKYKGMYYDCETYGQQSIEDIDYMDDNAVSTDVKGMAWYWARCGVCKREFRKVIRATHMRLYNCIVRGGFGDGGDYLTVEDIPCAT